ncbi:hypothetical protein PHMEG_0009894 [Phytophthora megakarya]|uniref:Cleavage induced protein n=1 Tax=Phytophthora megakarya TaxID=4795 RepID=A0A225WGE5_9STRA|nr:hypothetical protein PHMEG_0009894 [Phytophthora megakarya]
MINNYSFPREASVNEFTERTNFPAISYNPPRDIARCIYRLRSEFHYLEVLIMLGDVSGGFRHVPVHEDAVHMFAFAIDGYVIINLFCCVVRRYICTEVNSASRGEGAKNALRKAMLTVLGPTGINTKKFPPWSSTNKELGHLWNTVDGIVSIPLEMMDRALAQVDSVLSARKA